MKASSLVYRLVHVASLLTNISAKTKHLQLGDGRDTAAMYEKVRKIVSGGSERTTDEGQSLRRRRDLQGSVVDLRCFTECIEKSYSPEECMEYISNLLDSGDGHKVGDVVVKLQAPRTPSVMQRSYWLAEVPVNIWGDVACDRSAGKIIYPFLWESTNGYNETVDAIDCLGHDGAGCCARVREYGRQVLGKDRNGNCLACFVHREPLIPIDDTTFFDYQYDEIGGSCNKTLIRRPEVLDIDTRLRAEISLLRHDVEGLRSPTLACEHFHLIMDRLYTVASVVPQLPLILSRLACEFCYGEDMASIVPTADPLYLHFVARITQALHPMPEFDGAEKVIIVYSNRLGGITEAPKLGGSRADDPYDDGCDDNDSIFGDCDEDTCQEGYYCYLKRECRPYDGELDGPCITARAALDPNFVQFYGSDVKVCDPTTSYCFDAVGCRDTNDLFAGGTCQPWGSHCDSMSDCSDAEFCQRPAHRCTPLREPGTCCTGFRQCFGGLCPIDFGICAA